MTKKVAIASCHDKYNYGSLLQAYATEKAIERLGFDVVTVDKRGLGKEIGAGRRSFYRENLLDLSMYKAKLGFVRHRVKQRVDRSFGEKMGERNHAFASFADSRFNLSPSFSTFKDLGEYCAGFEAVVVGSDQLWLPVNIAGDYFTLSFVPDGVKKVSYATSFGVSSLSDDYLARTGEFLSSFSAISVRETTGAALVERAGREAAVVCDPTMLLCGDEWGALANCSYDLPAEPYIFCYFLGKNTWNRDCAKKLAERTGCKVLAISHLDEYVGYDDDGFADIQPYGVDPFQWVELLANATYVCTDSFHGSVFSCLFEKQFFTFRRHEGMGSQSTNSRLDTLLDKMGLTGRLCESKADFEAAAASDVDFAKTREALADYRSESLGWLSGALGVDAN